LLGAQSHAGGTEATVELVPLTVTPESDPTTNAFPSTVNAELAFQLPPKCMSLWISLAGPELW
jgi:hypothetical protein